MLQQNVPKSNVSMTFKYQVRITHVKSAFNCLQKIWKAPITKQKLKFSKPLLNQSGAESWSLSAVKTKHLDGVYTKMFRAI